MQIVTVEEMKALEDAANAAGFPYARMMENAGRAVARRVQALLASKGVSKGRIVCLVGSGNNGGDGLVASRLLAQETGHHVTCILTKPRPLELLESVGAPHITILIASDAIADTQQAIHDSLAAAHVIIDALVGTGFNASRHPEMAALLRQVHHQLEVATSRPIVVAVDLPSGLTANTGTLAAETLPADETVTFEALKPGHVCFPGAGIIGNITVAPLGLPKDIPQPPARKFVMGRDVSTLLPKRPADANKATFGRALIVAGSGNYVGAAGLAAESAYRCGAGLVSVATPEPNAKLLAMHLLEATWFPLAHEHGAIDESTVDFLWSKVDYYTALLIGPGLGQADATAAFIDVLFPPPTLADALPLTYPDPPPPAMLADLAAEPSDAASEHPPFPPLVLDADALNLLAKLDNWWERLPARTILTPHATEMARLCGFKQDGEQTPTQQVQANRFLLALEKAKQWNCVVILKGAHTIVADPDGRASVIPFASPALARAGTGDVLAGAVVGLLAQGLEPYHAATLAAYIHGTAGLLAAKKLGTTTSVLASDVLESLAPAIAGLEQTVIG